MLYRGSVRTNRVGSDCEFEFEVDDVEVAGLSPEAVQAFAESLAREAAFEHVEWNFHEVEE